MGTGKFVTVYPGVWTEREKPYAEEYFAKIKELEDKNGTLSSQLEEADKKNKDFEAQIAERDGKIKGYESSAMKTKIAREVGLPYEAAERLAGEDEDAIRKIVELTQKTPPEGKKSPVPSSHKRSAGYRTAPLPWQFGHCPWP